MALLELTRDRIGQGGRPEDKASLPGTPAPRRAWLIVGASIAGGSLASLGVTVPLLRVAGIAMAVAVLPLARNRRLAAVGGFLAAALAATGSDQSPDGSVGRYLLLVLVGIVGAAVAERATRPGAARRIALAAFAAVMIAAGALPSPTLPATGPSAAEQAGTSLSPAVADELDRWVRDQMRARRIPGLAISVTTTDDVQFERAWGVAGADRRELTTSTPVLLASVSKSFTGLAMAMLVDQGRLDLDARVQDYLPDFALAPGNEDHAAAITVADVPNQTTGLPRIEGINAVGRDDTLEEAVAHLATVEPVHPPGGTFEYSNLNFQLAGRLVEVASGQDYATFLRQEVLDPLGLRDTTAQVDETIEGLRRSDGYATLFGLMPRRHDRTVALSGVPAGGISSSVADLTRYLRLHLGKGTIDGQVVLEPTVLELQQQAPPGTDPVDGPVYNMGWSLGEDEQGRRIEHGGAWTNTSTTVSFRPDGDFGIAVVVPHMALADPAASKLRAGVEAILDGREPPAPRAYAISYAKVDLMVAGLLAAALLALSGVPHWRRRSRRSLGVRVPWVAVSHIGLPVATLIGWPASYGISWALQSRFLPDLVTVIVTSNLALVIAGVLKLAQLARPEEDGHPKETAS